MAHQVDEPVGIPPFCEDGTKKSFSGLDYYLVSFLRGSMGCPHTVVVPRHELEEVGVQHDTGTGVENTGARIVDEILGDNLKSTQH